MAFAAVTVVNYTKQPTVAERFDAVAERFNAVLAAPPSSIPHEKLHAKALEILRGNTVAKDEVQQGEVNADDDTHAEAKACLAFKKTSMEHTTCK